MEFAFGFGRPEIGELLELVLRTAEFEIEARDGISGAVNDYQRGKADFADCVIGRRNRSLGCEVTVSFDRRHRELPGFTTL